MTLYLQEVSRGPEQYIKIKVHRVTQPTVRAVSFLSHTNNPASGIQLN